MIAKFNIIAVTAYADATYRIELEPDPTDENSIKEFWGGTPTGRIELTVAEQPVGLIFPIGYDCYITFNPVPPPPA